MKLELIKLKEYFKRLVELAENAKVAYQEMIEEYEREECENLITLPPQSTFGETAGGSLVMTNGIGGGGHHQGACLAHANIDGVVAGRRLLPSNHLTNAGTSGANFQQPRIPSHMAHSRTPSNGSNISIEPYYHHMNYHTHSRSASGNFNYGQTTTASVSFGVGGNGGGAGGPLHSSAGGASGHVRTASGGGGIDLGLGKPWLPSHSRYLDLLIVFKIFLGF